MKKAMFLLVLAAALFAVGCTTTTKEVPSAYLPLADVDYTILGETSAEATGMKVLGFIWIGDKTFGNVNMEGREGFFGGLAKAGGVSKVKGNALYTALGSMPNAQALVNERYEIEYYNYLVAKKWTVKLRAHGIQFDEGKVVAK